MCVPLATALKSLLWLFVRRKWGERREGCLHKLMWGDRLPHCAWVLHCLQCLQTGSCLKVSIFVSTGCGTCQIIIDASLESISYSTNTAAVSGICADRVGAKWGAEANLQDWLAETEEKCMWDDRGNEERERESCEMGEVLLCFKNWRRFVA